MTATNDGIIHLRGKIEGGKLVALLDHQGQELGGPVTSKLNEVTGRIKITGVNPVSYLGKPSAMFVGDSLMDQCFIPSTSSRSARDWIMQADAELGGVLGRVFDAGVSGDNSSEIRANLAASLATNNPAIVIFGPISVNSIGDGITAEQNIADLQWMYDTAIAYPSVVQVFISTVHTPTAQSTVAASRRWLATVNAFVEAYGAAKNIPVIPFARQFTSQTSGGAKTNLSPDGTHLTYRGAYEMGVNQVKPVLRPLAVAPWSMPRGALNHLNLLGPAAALQGDMQVVQTTRRSMRV